MATLDTPTDTGGQMIAASKVNGTNVYDLTGTKLGSIYDVMIDKTTGRSQYAIMSFGGFLGMGEKFHPIPWSTLKYDPEQGGYVVDIDRRTLDGAPSYDSHDTSAWGDDSWGSRVDDYYGAPRRDDLRSGIIGSDPLLGAIPPR
jgi:sporulation protein YlmC with PRC-barrel domain